MDLSLIKKIRKNYIMDVDTSMLYKKEKSTELIYPVYFGLKIKTYEGDYFQRLSKDKICFQKIKR